MLKLNSDFTEIPTVGPTVRQRLRNLGLKKIQDLLFYFPYRYEDFSKKFTASGVKFSLLKVDAAGGGGK